MAEAGLCFLVVHARGHFESPLQSITLQSLLTGKPVPCVRVAGAEGSGPV